MEDNNVKVKSKAKIALVALTTFLLLCAIACVGVFLSPKEDEVVKVPEEITESGTERTAADEGALRKLLLEESELVIEVTEDIVADETFTVKGTKTLTGKGSISMELYVAPYQYLLMVDKEAHLTLDGVTVDGNGSTNCVKVEKGAQLTCLSGELTYGCPAIIESFGDVYIKGGSITDAIGTGVYIHGGGNLYMTAGTIQGCVDCGVENAVGSYMSISEQAILQDNMEYFVYNRGTCDITGGILRQAKSDMVYTSGIMNVKYQGEAGGMLEWYDIQGCGFVVGDGGELNADGVHIKDVGNRAITTAAGKSISNISNSLFENTKGDSVYVRTEVNLKNVEIKNSNLSGIRLIETGKAHIENVTVTGTVKDGIQNGGGVVTGKNFVVNKAGRIGVNSYKDKDVAGSVTLQNVTVNGTEKSNGLHVETSTLTVSNAKIKNTGNEGARAQKAGTLKLTNVEIQNAKGHNIASYDEGSKVIVQNAKTTGGKRGIGAFGGDVKATKVTINSPIEYGVTGSKKSVVEITDLTIKDSGKTGVNANNATINIVNATIQDPKATAGVNADYNGKVTLKNADIKFTEGTTGKIDGVKAGNTAKEGSPATITLEKVNIVNVPQHGMYALGAKAKILVTDVTTTGGKRGIQIYKGGQVEGKNVSITAPKEYGVTCGDKGSGFNLTKLTITGCGKHGVNVYDSAVATVADATITKPEDLGVFVGNKGKLTLNKATITKTKNAALMNSNGSLTLIGGIVDEAGKDSVHTFGGGLTKLTDVEVKNSTEHNIRIDNTGSKCVLKNVTTTGGKRGIQIWSGATVEGEKVTINSPAQYGITCGDEGSGFDIKDLTVTDNGNHALNVYGGAAATVTDGTLKNAAEHGAYVEKAILTLKGTLKIESPSQRGIINVGGTVDAENATVDIDNPGAYGVSTNVSSEKVQIEGEEKTVETPGTTTIGRLEVSSAGEESNAYSSMTVNGVGTVVTVLEGEIVDSWKHGINVEKGTLNLSNFKISGSGQKKGNDETYDGVQAQTMSTINLKNIEITGGSYGINIFSGGKVIDSEKVTIISPAVHGVACTNEGSSFDIKGLSINSSENGGYSSGNHAIKVNDKAQGTVDGGTITNPKGEGALVDSNAQLTLKNQVNITFDASRTDDRQGIKACNSATVTLSNVKIVDAPKNGIQIWSKADVVNSDNVTITEPNNYGVWSSDAGSTFNITNLIINRKGDTGLSSGNDAIYVSYGAEGTVKGGTITNPKGDGAKVREATATLENVKVIFAQGRENADIAGVRARNKAKVTLKGVEVENAPRDGVVIWSQSEILEASNTVSIKSPKRYGIWCGDDGSAFNITNLTVASSGDSGVNVYSKGAGTINGGTINGTGNHGVHLTGSAQVTLKGILNINSVSQRGLYNESGTVYGSEATVNITNSGNYGLSAKGSTTIGVLNVTGAQGSCAVTANNKGTVLTINGGTILNSNKVGVNAAGGTIVNLTNCKIQNSGTFDLQAEASNSTINLKNTEYNKSKVNNQGTINE